MMPRSGAEIVKQAKKAGLRTEMGKGDHCKIIAPAGRGYMVVPLHKELGYGLECKILKWLKLIGIVMVLGVLIACPLSMLQHLI
jgi:hypothetical protein